MGVNIVLDIYLFLLLQISFTKHGALFEIPNLMIFWILKSWLRKQLKMRSAPSSIMSPVKVFRILVHVIVDDLLFITELYIENWLQSSIGVIVGSCGVPLLDVALYPWGPRCKTSTSSLSPSEFCSSLYNMDFSIFIYIHIVLCNTQVPHWWYVAALHPYSCGQSLPAEFCFPSYSFAAALMKQAKESSSFFHFLCSMKVAR